MICRPCRRAADNMMVLGAAWSENKHATCQGGTWCDCQHLIPENVPREMAKLGTEENARLVSIAAGIELEDMEFATAELLRKAELSESRCHENYLQA